MCVLIFWCKRCANVPKDMYRPPSCHLTWGDGLWELTHFGGEEMSRIFTVFGLSGTHVHAHKQTHTHPEWLNITRSSEVRAGDFKLT